MQSYPVRTIRNRLIGAVSWALGVLIHIDGLPYGRLTDRQRYPSEDA